MSRFMVFQRWVRVRVRVLTTIYKVPPPSTSPHSIFAHRFSRQGFVSSHARIMARAGAHRLITRVFASGRRQHAASASACEASSSSSANTEALACYRNILRAIRAFPADAEPLKTEARSAFEANRNITDETARRKLLEAAQTRITLAHHYGIPFDRPQHDATLALPETKHRPSPVHDFDSMGAAPRK